MPADTAPSGRTPARSDAHLKFGQHLKAIRDRARATTRQVPKPGGGYFNSGYLTEVENGRRAFSDSIITAYATLGGDYIELSAMAARVNKLGEETDLPPPEALTHELRDPTSGPQRLRFGYALDSLDGFVQYASGGYWTSVNFDVTVRPLFPAARFYAFQAGHSDVNERGMLSIDSGEGCRIAHLEESDRGVITAAIQFDPDRRDELGRCAFSWRVTSNVTDKAQRTEEISASKTYVRRITWRIQFTEPSIPARVWRFRDMSSLRSDLNLPYENELSANAAHYYGSSFTDIENEIVGLIWRWD